jgi:predicted kinase
MPILYIIRGLPGSGKSTLAHKLTPHVFEADDYFTTVVDGESVYKFDREQVPKAHQQCRKRVEAAMKDGLEEIAVANTFSRYWEYKDYLILSDQYIYEVQINVCTSKWENVHGCPSSTIRLMKQRMEPSFMNIDEYHDWLVTEGSDKINTETLRSPVLR